MTSNFTVDTHLFRELGELLVGRDSTALIELIKNSYDADATEVVVLGQHLSDPDRGLIVVADNGVGMTPSQFERGFLRVASRLKDDGDRRSLRLKRRFTGAKGIGRLAAHKLARLLEVESNPWVEPGAKDQTHRQAVEARIDWDAIEAFETLSQISDSGAIKVEHRSVPQSAESGTVLRLSRLRRKWTQAERARFFAEVQQFAPPEFLTRELRRAVVSKDLLFKEPLVRSEEAQGQSFSVKLEGDFASGDDYWRLMEDHAAWVLEIRCRPDDNQVHFAIAPTKRTLKPIPEAKPYTASQPHPDPENGPFFDARIFLRVGQLAAKGDKRTWASRSSGIRIYMEGFRVLPYGEPQNDWLKLDSDYTRRSRTLDTLTDWDLEDLDHPDDQDAGLSFFPNNNYFGGVFLVHENAENLRMLVNREGFVPEGGYDQLVLLIRTGIDLCTRVHASASYPHRQERKEQRRKGRTMTGQGDSTSAEKSPAATAASLRASLEGATSVLTRARAHVVSTAADGSDAGELVERLDEVLGGLREHAASAEEMISEQSLLRVLASVGTQMSAFVHEIRALLGASQAVEQALDALASEGGLKNEHKRRLKQVLRAIGELRRGLEREASYLTDIVSPDARRRRSRQKIFDRFDVATRLIAPTAERRRITIENEIPKSVRSLPMFPAELTAVFTNLLSNAVKAAGEGGRIRALADRAEDGALRIVVENTGVAVDLEDAEDWFRPFQSTTAEVDPVLGQGMGLGLPITRRMLDDYGAEIRFVSPKDSSFATAIQMTFPGDE